MSAFDTCNDEESNTDTSGSDLMKESETLRGQQRYNETLSIAPNKVSTTSKALLKIATVSKLAGGSCASR